VFGRRQREGKFERLEGRLAAAQRRIAELERELETRAGLDALTGLLNLRGFGQRLDVEVERSRRHGNALSVAVLDIDGFRALNARHGRKTGDEVLTAVGRILNDSTRAADIACHASADEFSVMLPETDGAGAMKTFERIMLELESTDIEAVRSVSASVGIAVHKRGQTSDELMAEAGKALDRARAAGGSRTELIAAESEQAHGDRDETDRDVVVGLAGALLERDRYTGEHSESVVNLAARVAKGLALDDQEVQKVRAAAMLHDIGKVAIPDEVLNKPGKLDEREWRIMREHPVIGERILRAIPGLGGVARIVRHEHERWDGSGYPDRLKGDEIPIGSRIILACDAYHAMTSDRPYRKAMSHGEAIRELAAGADTQFDPEVTQALIGCLYGQRQGGTAAPASAA
jgi:diguanylate cyclase (GGDEF)-like protein/putative nucleotidyltransferase with HDIG domain